MLFARIAFGLVPDAVELRAFHVHRKVLVSDGQQFHGVFIFVNPSIVLLHGQSRSPTSPFHVSDISQTPFLPSL